MNVCIRRKIDSECAFFKINQYSVIENKGKVTRLVCRERVLKRYNVKRRYDFERKVKNDVQHGKLRKIEA